MLFIGPSLVALLMFLLGPMIASFGVSLTSWDLLTPPHFVGFNNYSQLFSSPETWDALQHTLYFIVGYLPIVLVLGLGLAMLLNRQMAGLSFYRVAYFMPIVSSSSNVRRPTAAWCFRHSNGLSCLRSSRTRVRCKA
jgi:multiple sugar transport system permease protein